MALVEERRGLGKVWGWKDPRTVLFLPTWLELIPEATVVVDLQASMEVMDSLFRRANLGDKMFERDPALAARLYVGYNAALLKLARSHPQRTVVLGLDQLLAKPSALTICSGSAAGSIFGTRTRRC